MLMYYFIFLVLVLEYIYRWLIISLSKIHVSYKRMSANTLKGKKRFFEGEQRLYTCTYGQNS